MMIIRNYQQNFVRGLMLVMKTTVLGPFPFAIDQELLGSYCEPVLPYTVLNLLLACRSTPPGNLQAGELQVSSKLQ